MGPDARLSGRGGGDPKGVSAGGGNLALGAVYEERRNLRQHSRRCLPRGSSRRAAGGRGSIVEDDNAERDRPSVPSNQKRDSGHSLFRLSVGPEVLLHQRFVPENRRLLPLSGGKQVENETSSVF